MSVASRGDELCRLVIVGELMSPIMSVRPRRNGKRRAPSHDGARGTVGLRPGDTVHSGLARDWLDWLSTLSLSIAL